MEKQYNQEASKSGSIICAIGPFKIQVQMIQKDTYTI